MQNNNRFTNEYNLIKENVDSFLIESNSYNESEYHSNIQEIIFAKLLSEQSIKAKDIVYLNKKSYYSPTVQNNFKRFIEIISTQTQDIIDINNFIEKRTFTMYQSMKIFKSLWNKFYPENQRVNAVRFTAKIQQTPNYYQSIVNYKRQKTIQSNHTLNSKVLFDWINSVKDDELYIFFNYIYLKEKVFDEFKSTLSRNEYNNYILPITLEQVTALFDKNMRLSKLLSSLNDDKYSKKYNPKKFELSDFISEHEIGYHKNSNAGFLGNFNLPQDTGFGSGFVQKHSSEYHTMVFNSRDGQYYKGNKLPLSFRFKSNCYVQRPKIEIQNFYTLIPPNIIETVKNKYKIKKYWKYIDIPVFVGIDRREKMKLNIKRINDIDTLRKLIEDDTYPKRFVVGGESVWSKYWEYNGDDYIIEGVEVYGVTRKIYNLREVRHKYYNYFDVYFDKFIYKWENILRKELSIPLINEGWVSQAHLYHIIKGLYPKTKREYSPKWLGRQRLDIFIPEINTAIEYQGKQHFEPVEFFGGKEGFKKNQERDKLKRKKCKANKVKLLYWSYELPITYKNVQDILGISEN